MKSAEIPVLSVTWHLVLQLLKGVSNLLPLDIAISSTVFFSNHPTALKPSLAKYRAGNWAK